MRDFSKTFDAVIFFNGPFLEMCDYKKSQNFSKCRQNTAEMHSKFSQKSKIKQDFVGFDSEDFLENIKVGKSGSKISWESKI